MSSSSLLFGDIIEFSGEQYIFLVMTDDVLYVAKILDLEKSRLLEKNCDNAIRKNKMIKNPLYCYVKLTTKEFKDRLAHCGLPGRDILPFGKLPIILREEDKKEIYKEITQPNSPVPIELKKLVKGLDIKI